MIRLIRILVAVFLLTIIGAAAIPFVVPVDSMKDTVLARIQHATGRKVSMGKMSLSVFPDIALKASDVSIGNPAWAGQGDMATIKTLRVGVELMPLLHKELRLKELTLESPAITLVKRGGDANWQIGGGPAAPSAAPPPAALAPSAASSQESRSPGQFSPGQFSFEAINIKDGVVTYHDAAQPAPVTLTDINLTMKAPNPEKEATLSGSAVYNGDKADIDLTLARPQAVMSGGPADMTLKVRYGTLEFGWKGAFSRKNDVPNIAGALDIREIDTTAFKKRESGAPATAAPETGSPNTGRPPEGGPWSDAPLRLDGLKGIHADIDLTIGKLMLPRTTLDDIHAAVKLDNGLLSLSTNDIPAYDGVLKLALKASSANAVSLALVVSHVKAEPLLHDFAHYDNLSGTMTAHLSLATSGASERAMIRALAGQGDFAFQNGSLRGHNIAAMARNIGAAFQGGGDQKSTDFTELSGTFTVKGGVVANHDLKMSSPLLRVGGEGTADLAAFQADYLLKPSVVPSLEGQGGEAAAGIVVPIRIRGPLGALTYKPDLKSALQDNLNTIKDPSQLKASAKALKQQLLGGGKLNGDALKELLR